MDTTTPLPTLGAQAGPGGSSAGTGPAARRSRPNASPIVREALTFGAIGIVSTVAYAALFVGLRGVMDATTANAASLVITAVGNTAANRRLTFGVRGRASMARDQAAGLVAFGVALLLTSASIAVLDRVAPGAGRTVELVVLVAANAAATVTRFVLLRAWISRRPRATTPSSGRRTARVALRPAAFEGTVR